MARILIRARCILSLLPDVLPTTAAGPPARGLLLLHTRLALAERILFADKLWLAPLTRGGHLAFRRLCVELGAQVTVSERVVVRNLQRGKSAEFALLRSHPSEGTHARLADALLGASSFDDLRQRASDLSREVGPPAEPVEETDLAAREVAG